MIPIDDNICNVQIKSLNMFRTGSQIAWVRVNVKATNFIVRGMDERFFFLSIRFKRIPSEFDTVEVMVTLLSRFSWHFMVISRLNWSDCDRIEIVCIAGNSRLRCHHSIWAFCSLPIRAKHVACGHGKWEGNRTNHSLFSSSYGTSIRMVKNSAYTFTRTYCDIYDVEDEVKYELWLGITYFLWHLILVKTHIITLALPWQRQLIFFLCQ